MSASTTEFKDVLHQLNATRPPGVSGSRIRKLVEFSVYHPGDYKQIVDDLVDFLAESPTANKLGTIYVIDAIIRAYQDEARKNKRPEFAAGFELLQRKVMDNVDDLCIRQQSTGQFDKMQKVIEIWQKADTFPLDWLEEVRKTQFKEPYTTTPPGSPPPSWGGLPEDAPLPESPVLKPSKPAPSANDVFGILQSLTSKPSSKSGTPQESGSGGSSGISASSNSTAPSSSSSDSNAKTSNPADILQQLLKQSSAASTSASAGARPTESSYQRGRDAASQTAHNRNHSRSPSRQTTPEQLHQPKTRAGDATRNLHTDPSLLPDKIKVYSRTLYVAAIPDRFSDADVRSELESITKTQSIIYNKDRHHAFVKVSSRGEAERLRNHFESLNKQGKTPLRIKWGVGFGPRECFDYFKGISVIEVMRLTDADKKWATSAEYGGTGGKPLEPGMVMEEPDIEVGAGILGSKNQHRQKMLQQQQMMMPGMPMPGMPMPGMMPGMPGMMPGMMPPGMSPVPNSPSGTPQDLAPGSPMAGMPGAMPGAMPGMPGAMPGMPGMPMPGMPMPGMPGMPGAMPGMPMPGMPMPGMPGMPGGSADMQQMFAQMQQQMMQAQAPKQE